MLLACLMACQEHTALLTHSLTLSLAGSPYSPALVCRGQPIAPTPPTPWSTGRQVQSGGAPERGAGAPAMKRQGRPGPSPNLLCPISKSEMSLALTYYYDTP